jgi:hypothetical protein
MAKFEGRGKCDCCKRGVDVYSDKNGMAYYNCGPCGFRGLHRARRTSDSVLAGLERDATPEDGGAPAPKPAAPAPAPRPAAPAPSPNTPPAPPAPPAKRGGFLSQFTLP